MKQFSSSLFRRFGPLIAVLFGVSLPMTSAHAFVLNTCWAGFACVTPASLFLKMNDAFFLIAGVIALTIFLVGAFMMVISAGQDTLLQAGKRAMKGSLIGLALVAGSYGVYRTVIFWLY